MFVKCNLQSIYYFMKKLNSLSYVVAKNSHTRQWKFERTRNVGKNEQEEAITTSVRCPCSPVFHGTNTIKIEIKRFPRFHKVTATQGDVSKSEESFENMARRRVSLHKSVVTNGNKKRKLSINFMKRMLKIIFSPHKLVNANQLIRVHV